MQSALKFYEHFELLLDSDRPRFSLESRPIVMAEAIYQLLRSNLTMCCGEIH